MSKLKTIIFLLLLLVCIFLIDIFIGNPLRETFKGKECSECKETKNEEKSTNVNYSNGKFLRNFLGEFDKSDDQPSFFGYAM